MSDRRQGPSQSRDASAGPATSAPPHARPEDHTGDAASSRSKTVSAGQTGQGSGSEAGASGAAPDDRLRNTARLRPLLALKPYVMRNPRMLALALVALVASSLAMLSLPIAVRRMIDFGFSASAGGGIDRYFASMAALGLLLAVASATRFYAVNWLGERVVADVRSDVFRHLLSLGPSVHDRLRTGDIVSRLTADTTQLKSASGSSLSQALRNTIMLLGAVVMMAVTSPLLTSLVVFAIPAIVVPLLVAGRFVRAKSRGAQDTLADASAYAAENLGAIRTVQATVSERHVSGRFTRSVDRAFEAARSRLLARAVLTAAAIFIVVAGIVGVLWYGATKVVAGEMSGGLLGQFVLYAVLAGGAIAELSEVWGELSQAAGAAERLVELLAARPDVPVAANPVPLPQPPLGSLAFERVAFAYPARPETTALRDVSFTVAPGETVALVGPSGAGKSTILSLVLRFYYPSQGRILVDGVPIRNVDPTALRDRLAVVPQDVALFADTVAENIRYGRPDATDAAVEDAARRAHADEFIRALPQGYATELGERGVTLSGGQRQRIAIARAILRDCPILLLDEATSALDAESEAAVQAALEGVMAGRTTLVIAHRLATVQQADRILVLDEGGIVEQGTHASLIAGGGLYARLAALQFNLTQAAGGP